MKTRINKTLTFDLLNLSLEELLVIRCFIHIPCDKNNVKRSMDNAIFDNEINGIDIDSSESNIMLIRSDLRNMIEELILHI